MQKKDKTVSVSIPSYIDSQGGQFINDASANFSGSKLDYRSFGMFTNEIRKRSTKMNEKLSAKLQAITGGATADPSNGLQPVKRTRGRKTKSRVLEE